MESSWFQRRLGQRDLPDIKPGWSGDEGWDIDPDTPVAELVARYEAACAQSRRVAAGLALDGTVPHHPLRERARREGEPIEA